MASLTNQQRVATSVANIREGCFAVGKENSIAVKWTVFDFRASENARMIAAPHEQILMLVLLSEFYEVPPAVINVCAQIDDFISNLRGAKEDRNDLVDQLAMGRVVNANLEIDLVVEIVGFDEW